MNTDEFLISGIQIDDLRKINLGIQQHPVPNKIRR